MIRFEFRKVSHRILFAVGASVAVGLGVLVLFFTQQQEHSILAQNERTLTKVSDSVIEGLRTVMEAGYANVGSAMFERMKDLGKSLELRVLAADGTLAFRDNRSIDDVNGRLNSERFSRRTPLPTLRAEGADTPEFRRTASGEGLSASYYRTQPDGERLFTLLTAIGNEKACHKCHGEDRKVLGILALTASLAEVDSDIQRTWLRASGVLAVTILFALLSVSHLLHLTVVHPIQRITRAMHLAAKGDLSQEVPVLGNDELAHIAGSFNRMIREVLRMYSDLHRERNKLSTIILGAQEGIIVTDRSGQIVLVNPAA
ncbi:MAG: HAMP domain-containing protein, partial [Alphaproteobacteria bacterium]